MENNNTKFGILGFSLSIISPIILFLSISYNDNILIIPILAMVLTIISAILCIIQLKMKKKSLAIIGLIISVLDILLFYNYFKIILGNVSL